MTTTQLLLCTLDNYKAAHSYYYAYFITTEQLLICTFEEYNAAMTKHISHSNCKLLLRIVLNISQ